MRIADEVRDAELGDERRTARLLRIAKRMARSPGASFPMAAMDDVELEGFYRFFQNKKVTFDKLLEPHIERTIGRCRDAKVVLVAYDTTEFRYSGPRGDLGRLDEHGFGHYAHVALAMTADGRREVLGVLGARFVTRHAPAPEKRTRKREGDANEATRWPELAVEVHERLAGHAEVVGLMDSEADSIANFFALRDVGARFIVRGKWDRRLVAPPPAAFALRERLASAEQMFTREVPLSSRKQRAPKDARVHPARRTRLATLTVSGIGVVVRNPRDTAVTRKLPPALPLNVVHVQEVNPPAGEQPVDWVLLTTEPVDTLEQLAFVIDSYRARWVIEEYFKALKTGCALEKRQLESEHALKNVLAVFIPIAWQMLRLRTTARDEPDRAATTVVPPTQLRILQVHRSTKLRKNPTVVDALNAIAKLGGHLKRNGAPGWQTIGRGMEKLLSLEAGVRLAREM